MQYSYRTTQKIWRSYLWKPTSPFHPLTEDMKKMGKYCLIETICTGKDNSKGL